MGGMLALNVVLSTAGEVISAQSCVGTLIDNMALISHIQTWHHQGSGGTLRPEYDLLQVAKGIMAKHKLVVKPEHVKSHQDTDTEYSNLSWKAQLNCDCDQLAGSTRTCPQGLETSPTPYIFPTGHIASLEIDGTFITSHIASAIKEASLRSEFIKYVIHQSGWQDPTVFHSIDWAVRACTSLHSSPSQHLTIFKLAFELFATMSCRHRMEKAMDHRCPSCQRFQETLTHVFQCPHGSSIRTTAWSKAISTIKKTSTCPFIVATLGNGMSQWSTGGPVQWQGPTPALDDSIGQVVFTAFQEQQSIG